MGKYLTTIGKTLKAKPTAVKNSVGYFSLFMSIFGFGLSGNTAAMGIGVAGSGIFLAFANLEKFTRFKGAGFEAEMRDIVDEANATIDNLRSVATPLISSYITNLSNEGLMFTSEPNNKRTRYDEILKLQTELKIDHASITEARRRYLTLESWNIFSELLRDIHPRNDNEKYPDNAHLQMHSKFVKEIGHMGWEKLPDLEKSKDFLHKEHSEQDDLEKIDLAITSARNVLTELKSLHIG